MGKDLVCPICGEPTRVYMGNARKDRLCGKHADMLKKGELVLDENGKAVYPFRPDDIEEETEHSVCVICGEPSFGKPQCKSCYNETRDFIETFDKNSTIHNLRDYYYNLKERIVIIKTIKEAQRQCNKLIAIAIASEEFNRDTSLIDRVYQDAEKLLKSKKETTRNTKYEEEQIEKDKAKSRINTAQDGHIVESDMEVRIDDILYNAFILHCYGIGIEGIDDKRKKCDWFIPIVNGKGIYIEYWGKRDKDYLKTKKEKIELYEKHNIPYIGIEADEPKYDSQGFKSNLIRQIIRLAKEHYGFVPEWIKK